MTNEYSNKYAIYQSHKKKFACSFELKCSWHVILYVLAHLNGLYVVLLFLLYF